MKNVVISGIVKRIAKDMLGGLAPTNPAKGLTKSLIKSYATLDELKSIGKTVGKAGKILQWDYNMYKTAQIYSKAYQEIKELEKKGYKISDTYKANLEKLKERVEKGTRTTSKQVDKYREIYNLNQVRSTAKVNLHTAAEAYDSGTLNLNLRKSDKEKLYQEFGKSMKYAITRLPVASRQFISSRELTYANVLDLLLEDKTKMKELNDRVRKHNAETGENIPMFYFHGMSGRLKDIDKFLTKKDFENLIRDKFDSSEFMGILTIQELLDTGVSDYESYKRYRQNQIEMAKRTLANNDIYGLSDEQITFLYDKVFDTPQWQVFRASLQREGYEYSVDGEEKMQKAFSILTNGVSDKQGKRVDLTKWDNLKKILEIVTTSNSAYEMEQRIKQLGYQEN